MKTILLALTFSALVAVALTGCGSKAEDTTTATPPPINATPPTIPSAAGQSKLGNETPPPMPPAAG